MKWGLGYSSVGRLLALYSAPDPSQAQYKLSAAEQTCNSSAQEVEEGLKSQGYPQFHSKLRVSLGYLQSCDGKKARPKEEQEWGRGKLDEMWLAKKEVKIPPKFFPKYSNGHLLTPYRNTHSFIHFSRNSIKEESTPLQFYLLCHRAWNVAQALKKVFLSWMNK